ncbi:hypothetical protein CC86DRAFT_333008 [Ophiobolus disseminans]|uniref:Uncharacterized protein n=1 Tax=Ophiobolus disseminans TaxID=1469910 RepID=A0A6A6ZHK6_9PLEO|nr:hypothetical protein CC86DRAFT_333008 [Ophiobolus disseminans]
MLRNEQAIELRENKKARGDLRKCLKDSKLQLHQLEKQSKPARHRQLLRKNRPSTALRTSTADPDQTTSAPTTPSRPATAAGMSSFSPDTARSRHTIHFSPDTVISPDRPERPTTSTPLSTTRPERPNTSTPLSANRRWSTLHRPKSFHRPATSAGLHDDAPNERPTTSAGERVSHEHKERKRWSLRGMFK